MSHLPRWASAALLGTFLCTLVHRTSSLKVFRDSVAQNLTDVDSEYDFSSHGADSATDDSVMTGSLHSVWDSNVSPSTSAWPRRDEGNVSLLRFPLSDNKLTGSKEASRISIDSKTITRMILFLLLVILCIGLVVGYAEKMSDDSNSLDLSRSPLGKYSDHAEVKRPIPLAIESHDGDWSKTYHQAERGSQQQKNALDLLYLCNIIPVQEFLHAKVSQDHIDECIWIANAMLKQKTTREWLESGDYAREFFNSCVTALYEARADIKDSQRFESPLVQSAGNSPESLAKERVPLKRLGTNMLLERCREIMADTRRDAIPKSAPGTSTHLDYEREQT